MRTKLSFLMATVFALSICSVQKSIAQNSSPYWSLAGNSNATSTSKLGTTNNISLRFYTNNVQRMIINSAAGDIGIGTTSPTDRLHINAPSGKNALRVQVNGSTKLLVHSGGGVSIGTGTTPPANGLYVAGGAGIGTEHPEARLHVLNSSAGSVTAFGNTTIVAENSTNNYISLLAPSASESGVLFGNPTSNLDGGIVFNSSSFAPHGLLFLTGNNHPQMVLTQTGNLGVGTTTPDPYKLRVTHGSYGLDIQSSSTNNDWELYVGDNLYLIYDGSFLGSFNNTTGAYTSTSDERLKTNIKPMTTMLEKINQLKPSTYQFKNTKDIKEYNGFIAQDVMKIFPSMVTHNVSKERNLDVYTMDYTGFGVIAIKGIQELQPIVEEQKKINEEQKVTIQQLQDRITRLEALVASVTGQKGLQDISTIKDASLAQNEPNPLNQSTTIRYGLPHGSKGQINIYNQTGNLVKTLIANESGQSTLSGYDLKAGTYTYTFLVNGKIIDSKKMIVVR